MQTAPTGRLPSFRHGVHPDERKQATCRLVVEHMPFADEYVLPLSQHIGAPAKPVVTPGERVVRGQTVAEPGGFVSTALHAPVTGTVSSIELRPHPTGTQKPAIVIRTDALDSQRHVLAAAKLGSGASAAELVDRVQASGIVGLGGAAFPAHVKLKVPDGKHVRFAILNGCECEPYLTCDDRIMVERPEAVRRGLRLIMRLTGAEHGYVGIENNKPSAIDAMRAVTAEDADLTVVPVAVKYPEGAEKMLIDAILHMEVPTGKIPLDLDIVVNNVGTAAAITDAVDSGRPLVDRVVTVTGPGIRRPANVLVPIGTPLASLIDHCGGLRPEARQVILGGPMMGTAQKNLDVPITKGTSGVLVLTHEAPIVEEEPCIRCGRCLAACPMFLNPSRFALLARAERVEGLIAQHVNSCFECASCSYSCPSHIPLVHLIRVGKALVRERAAK